MLNLFEKLDRRALDLFVSLHKAGYNHPTVVLEDDGWLPAEVTSPLGFYLKQDKTGKPRYFSNIDVPTYYEIRGNNREGGVYDEEYKRANVIFAKPQFKRYVKEVQWIGNNGAIRSIDHYNQFGKIFAQTTCDANGKPAIKTFFDNAGHEKIIQNMTTGDITLYQGDLVNNFKNLTEFTAHYLIDSGFKLDRIFYNSLSYPLFVTRLLAQKNYKGDDVLFWQEPLADDLPGNMQMILQDNNSRTKQIIMQKLPTYRKAQELWPKDTKVALKLLGTIYLSNRENKGQSHALIMTNSDQIAQLETLVKLLPNVHFSIGAITEMSTSLMSFDKYQNVSLYPQIVTATTRRLTQECDFLLDINHGAEILDAVRGAFEHNMIILGFNDTLHNQAFIDPQNVYAQKDVNQMAEKINFLIKHKDALTEAVKQQRLAAGDDTPQAYRKILG